MHLPTLLLALLTAAPLHTTALRLLFREKESIAASPEDPKKGTISTCTGKTFAADGIKPSDGCQQLPKGYAGLMVEWQKPEDNGLTVETYEGQKCCAGSPGEWYAWSDSCYGIHLNVVGSYRVVNASNPGVGKEGENYDCSEKKA